MKHQRNPMIGLRTLKTGLSVALGVAFAYLIGLEYPFFVGMTALIAMERTLQRSVFMGKVRVVGSMIGAVVGICMGSIQRGNPLLIGVGIVLVILICNRLNLQPAITIGGIVFLWIMVHVGDASPFFYAFHRVFDSFVGASVSCLVNLLFLPYYHMGRLDGMIEQSCRAVLEIVERPDGQVDEAEMQEIHMNMRALEEDLALYGEEYLTPAKKTRLAEYNALHARLSELVFELSTLLRMENAPVPHSPDFAAVREYHRASVAEQVEALGKLATVSI